MKSPRHQLFSRARIAGYEGRPEVWGDPSNLLKHLQHERTSADDLFERASFQELVVQVQRLASLLCFEPKAEHAAAKSINVEGLGHEIARSPLNGLHR